MNALIARISGNKHFRFGVPFFLFIFGGQYALREFREIRYDSNLNPQANSKLLKPEEAFADFNEKSGKKIKFEKSNKSAEEELDSLDKKIDWDNWENKRGPRPWEDNQEPDREIKRVVKKPVTVAELLG
ncbi:cytochrome c oxidase assembly protein COX16 homolog, mitochondrial isoform X2 [Eurytemora carolleeae]|uniref:cytochrome c oxidase assembly protein COX16 homolog, mitochondrial isoform X2 n=1 Tax=Eurytemora carolleeae TaxID=1294199 RepID=UPI000C78547A|nr:cytochrome c oxidase assembly protein COX16 homolog, mitochondrial isoform X2 [Eurytemora carolleeae]|eukprot:XP_023326630.1 cytochrome c oxidase assembly protein COX16 homolog, mitochondrial-like isoform X2 [Eurytemora affinis]